VNDIENTDMSTYASGNRRKSVRLNIVLAFFYLVFFGLVARLFFLQIIKHDYYLDKSRDQLNRVIRLYPERGDILDRELNPIALTLPSTSSYLVPEKVKNKKIFVNEVSKITGLSKPDLRSKVSSEQPFVWLVQKMPAEMTESLKKLDMNALGFIDVEKRTYPNSGLMSQVVGFVGVDNQGLGGLEYKFDKELKGHEGMIMLEGDPLGRQLVFGKNKKVKKSDGKTIITTLDTTIQYVAEKHLKEGVALNDAKGGVAIVLGAQTGEILAMVDEPGFDPNKWMSSESIDRKNGCITDVYEPGSTLKVFTIMAAIEEKLVTPGTIIKVPETFMIAGHKVKEAHDREDGDVDENTVTEILEKSLNVGTSLVAQKLGKDLLYTYLRRSGYGGVTGVSLPGESSGLLRKPSTWSGVDISMLSFGQGIAVTPLQLAASLTIITNEGRLIKPRIIKGVMDADRRTLKATRIKYGEQVVSKSTANKMKIIMKSIVENGTGKITKLDGISSGGKTGTAQKAREDGRGYKKGAYIASFLGFFPIEDPKYIILVAVDEPKKSIWGSSVTGPIFKKIVQDIVDYTNMVPISTYP
jgi:cell division protein FtsI/penicillin-binding protein 2